MYQNIGSQYKVSTTNSPNATAQVQTTQSRISTAAPAKQLQSLFSANSHFEAFASFVRLRATLSFPLSVISVPPAAATA